MAGSRSEEAGHLPAASRQFVSKLDAPSADYSRPTSATQQSFEHTNHVNSLLIPLDSTLCGAAFPSHCRKPESLRVGVEGVSSNPISTPWESMTGTNGN